MFNRIRGYIDATQFSYTEEWHESCSLMSYSRWEKLRFYAGSMFWNNWFWNQLTKNYHDPFDEWGHGK